jgi:cytochrome c biogenesis protein CcdA/glutaredoxin
MSAPARFALALMLALGAWLTLAAPAAAQPQRQVELVFFYGRGCPHCANMKQFLESMQAKYPQLRVLEREVYFDAGNARLFERVAAGYGVPIEGVPTVFVGDRVIGGYSEQMAARVEQGIRDCIERGCASPLARTTAGPANAGITLSAVAAGASVDAINPCAFAVLIILISAILASGGRQRALYAGLAFYLSIFISYYLMGLGLYSAVRAAAATQAIYVVAAVLAILIGLFNLKDYLWYGKWFAMEVPQSWRPALKRLIQSVTSVPGAFLIGFAVSLFLLPCTSGPYIVILGLLAKTATRSGAMLWLLLYNAIFVLPMVLITGAVYYGFTTAERVEAWRATRLPLLHMVAGIILLLLGLAMAASLWLGAV